MLRAWWPFKPELASFGLLFFFNGANTFLPLATLDD
jgi:hypothetical protein